MLFGSTYICNYVIDKKKSTDAPINLYLLYYFSHIIRLKLHFSENPIHMGQSNIG